MAVKPLRSALYSLLLSDLLSVMGSEFLPSSADSGAERALPPDADVKSVAALQLAKSIVKKFKDEIDKPAADKAALEKFIAANNGCVLWKPPQWNTESLQGLYEAELVGEWREQLRRFFETPPRSYGSIGASLEDEYPQYDWTVLLDASKIVAFSDVGPGASLEAEGNSFVEKFDGEKVTYGDSHLVWLWELRTQDPRWRDLDISRLCRSYHLVETQASRLMFVLKTVSESRTICVEPLLNTFFQKGAQWLLELQLKLHFGIDLAIQQAINRELARVGSINGKFATIDLRSASDTISTNLVRYGCPKHQFKYLDWLRTQRTVYGKKPIPLHMFSTMGNATTFPLQTAIFAAAVAAVYRIHGIPLIRGKRGIGISQFTERCDVFEEHSLPNWGVNGDDIIVVREAYDDVIKLLSLLGFTPNSDKSFNEGLFRESCGGDYYAGQSVRGVYCRSLETDQDVNSLINRLMQWSVDHDIALPNTLGWLKARLRRVLYVPFHESDVAGIKLVSDCLPRVNRVRRRGNSQLHGRTYQKWVPDMESVSVPPMCDEDGQTITAEGLEWPFSPAATWLSVLRGELSGGVLTRRLPQGVSPPYRTVWSWTHSWDSRPLVGGQWKHCLVPLTEEFKLRYTLKLHVNRIV